MEFLGTRRKVDEKEDGDESSNRKRKGLPAHLQEVRDDQGRQRLHGAFQGGFSAGYYNTVGSKEGWQPKQFKSGRSGQKDRIEQMNAFDFMDADDIQEFGSRVLKEQFEHLGSTERDLKRKRAINDVGEKGVFGSKIIDDLVVALPTADIGKRLFESMKKPSKKAEDGDAVLLKLLAMKASQTAMETYGRGYDPLHNAPEFQTAAARSSEKEASKEESEEGKSSKGKAQMKSRGFGTGIFDDEEDDEDYATGSLSKSDFNTYIGEDDEEDDVFKKRAKAKNRDSGKSNDGPVVVKSFSAPANAGGGRKGGILTGFVSKPMNYNSVSKLHVAPIPPVGWEPLPSFLQPFFLEKKAQQKVEEAKSAAENAKNGNQSIFSYLNTKNKERLDSFLNQVSSKSESGITTALPPSKGPSMPPPIYSVPTKIAEAALKGFMPFGNDLPKQARYRRFLEDIIEKSKTDDMQTNPVKMSDDDALESREFSKAAMIYRPLSNMIASRFTNETGQDATPDKEELAPVKMLRTVGKWKPSKLMCKRFAVVHHDDSDDEEKDKAVLAESKQALNPETMKNLMEERDKLLMVGEISANLEDITPSELLTKNDIMEEFMDASIGQKEEALVEVDIGVNEEKPSMDLFKAIFADSDSDSDNDEKSVIGETISEPLQPVPAPAISKGPSAPKPAPASLFTVARPPPAPAPAKPQIIQEAVKKTEATEDDSPASFFRAKSKIHSIRKPTQEESVTEEPVSFKPVFSGASKSTKTSAVVVGSRKKKAAIRVVAYDDDEEEVDRKIKPARPSASDFM